jgi:hypothetical protein
VFGGLSIGDFFHDEVERVERQRRWIGVDYDAPAQSFFPKRDFLYKSAELS